MPYYIVVLYRVDVDVISPDATVESLSTRNALIAQDDQ